MGDEVLSRFGVLVQTRMGARNRVKANIINTVVNGKVIAKSRAAQRCDPSYLPFGEALTRESKPARRPFSWQRDYTHRRKQ